MKVSFLVLGPKNNFGQIVKEKNQSFMNCEGFVYCFVWSYQYLEKSAILLVFEPGEYTGFFSSKEVFYNWILDAGHDNLVNGRPLWQGREQKKKTWCQRVVFNPPPPSYVRAWFEPIIKFIEKIHRKQRFRSWSSYFCSRGDASFIHTKGTL